MRTHRLLLLACLMLLAPMVSADVVLVANPNSGIVQLSQSEVINIYLGRYRRLPTGSTAVPIDLSDGADVKVRFYQLLVNKNLAEINAYWSRLVFSGKTRPPLEVVNVNEALKKVANNINALAYMDRANVNSQVIIVFEWPSND